MTGRGQDAGTLRPRTSGSFAREIEWMRWTTRAAGLEGRWGRDSSLACLRYMRECTFGDRYYDRLVSRTGMDLLSRKICKRAWRYRLCYDWRRSDVDFPM